MSALAEELIVLAVRATVVHGEDFDPFRRAIEAKLDQMRTEGVSEEEIARAGECLREAARQIEARIAGKAGRR